MTLLQTSIQIIGWAVLVLIGLYVFIEALAVAIVVKALGGKVDWLPTAILSGIGVACWWAAAKVAPFSVSWVG